MSHPESNPSRPPARAFASPAGPDTVGSGGDHRSRRTRWAVWGLAGLTAASLVLGGCGFGRHGRGHDQAGDPAERVSRMVDRVFSSVDASDDQKARINTIATRAMTQMKPHREAMRNARTDGINLLSAATIDRGAIETLRQAQIGQASQASTIMSTAMADIAEVLTPEQRVQMREKVLARMEKQGGRHGWGWRH